MNTLPPGFARGQTTQYPRVSIAVTNDRERWMRLQASEAKIVAYTVANHVYGGLRVRAFHERLSASWLVVNDHNIRAFARDFVAWDLGDLSRDFERSSFTRSVDVLSASVDELVEMLSRSVPGVRRRLVEGLALTDDRKVLWCALTATRLRRELNDTLAVMRHHHRKAKGAPDAEMLEHVEIVEESSNAAHVGIMRAMRYVQQRTEATYNEAMPLVLRLLDESAVVDFSELCSLRLQQSAQRLRGMLDRAPDMRDELLALGLDAEMQALVMTCAPPLAIPVGLPPRSTTLKRSRVR